MHVNLKKYAFYVKHFVLLLTFTLLIACVSQKKTLQSTASSSLAVTETLPSDPTIEAYITPYRKQLDVSLDKVLSQSADNLDKSGTWQTPMGNLLADIILDQGSQIYKKPIDMSLINHGGIRSTLSKGPISVRNVYEIMPFENKALVILVSGEVIREFIAYFISEKKPHGFSGLTFRIAENLEATDIEIQGKPLVDTNEYTLITSDFLYNGGDNMTFLKKGKQVTDLDYKLRNMFIDYFATHPLIVKSTTERIRKD